MYHDDHHPELEALLARLEALFPDPVDVFEDRLAARLGLLRGPGVSDARWRTLRVSFIDAHDPPS
jgi:hypothetical protein